MKPEWKIVTRAAVGLFAGICTAFGAFAADRHPCSTVVDGAARLACYDAVFGAPAAATSPPASMQTPAPASAGASAAAPAAAVSAAAAIDTSAVQADPVAAFGNEQVKRPKPTAAREPPESITSTVRSVSKRPYGELVVELENGQTWVQQEADSSVRIRPGDTVVIERAALGAYKLVSGPNVTRVKRVK